MIALPDPGEAMRACPTEDEIITSIPVEKVLRTVDDIRQMDERNMGYLHTPVLMQADYEQPPMYRALFKQWGLIEDD
jgi:hypothetical protein